MVQLLVLVGFAPLAIAGPFEEDEERIIHHAAYSEVGPDLNAESCEASPTLTLMEDLYGNLDVCRFEPDRDEHIHQAWVWRWRENTGGHALAVEYDWDNLGLAGDVRGQLKWLGCRSAHVIGWLKPSADLDLSGAWVSCNDPKDPNAPYPNLVVRAEPTPHVSVVGMYAPDMGDKYASPGQYANCECCRDCCKTRMWCDVESMVQGLEETRDTAGLKRARADFAATGLKSHGVKEALERMDLAIPTMPTVNVDDWKAPLDDWSAAVSSCAEGSPKGLSKVRRAVAVALENHAPLTDNPEIAGALRSLAYSASKARSETAEECDIEGELVAAARSLITDGQLPELGLERAILVGRAIEVAPSESLHHNGTAYDEGMAFKDWIRDQNIAPAIEEAEREGRLATAAGLNVLYSDATYANNWVKAPDSVSPHLGREKAQGFLAQLANLIYPRVEGVSDEKFWGWEQDEWDSGGSAWAIGHRFGTHANVVLAPPGTDGPSYSLAMGEMALGELSLDVATTTEEVWDFVERTATGSEQADHEAMIRDLEFEIQQLEAQYEMVKDAEVVTYTDTKFVGSVTGFTTEYDASGYGSSTAQWQGYEEVTIVTDDTDVRRRDAVAAELEHLRGALERAQSVDVTDQQVSWIEREWVEVTYEVQTWNLVVVQTLRLEGGDTPVEKKANGMGTTKRKRRLNGGNGDWIQPERAVDLCLADYLSTRSFSNAMDAGTLLEAALQDAVRAARDNTEWSETDRQREADWIQFWFGSVDDPEPEVWPMAPRRLRD